ncbi:MAG TPA: siderophore-interacting protein [Microbacteriaceae bacterium]|nr:siderophore-interacting protein [Microbacteriaceae bacterium]
MSAEHIAAQEAEREARPFAFVRAIVEEVERVSPSFVRVTFGGRELDEFGTPGAVFDQRIKLIFPPAGGELPDLAAAGAGWWDFWLTLPEAERGSIRTYSIRELLVEESGTRLVVDFVLHLAPGLTGPASWWASGAKPGDELLILGPRRGRVGGGGIEYAPGDAPSVLLAGDETAAPAIARILEDADPDLRGIAFIEVPEEADALAIAAPAGVAIHWLARDGRRPGEALIPAVLEHLGAATAVEIRDVETEDLVWETPVYSGLGEELVASGQAHADRYYWIAGESGVVTTLRRHLVKDLGIDRAQVAFMGYWRIGVAMRG